MIDSFLDKRKEVEQKNRPITISYRTIKQLSKVIIWEIKNDKKGIYLSED